MPKLPILLFAAALSTATAADLAKEYEQVKTIAMRDPKVRAAYAEADRKLAEKIVQIDPALKGYKPGQRAAAPATKPHDKSAYTRSHVVARGDTVSSIAAKYRVDVAELRRINGIKDDRKLPVGQVLAIPNTSVKSAPKATPKPAAKKKEGGWWEQLKSSF